MENFNFKKFFRPRREFAEKTKEIYLTAFNEKFSAFPKRTPIFAFNYALRGAGVFAAIFLLIGGTSAYAYEKNVGPTSILYPLKRVHENIRLNFTPNEQKSSFHLGLAEKRLAEAEILTVKNADSSQAIRLVEEFKSEVKKSFETLPGPQETQEPISAPAPTPAAPQEQPQPQPQSQSQQKITKPTPVSKPIQIISPNGGEVFKQGTPIKISWRMIDLSPKDRPYVHLYLRPYVDVGYEKSSLNKIDANLNCFKSLPYPIDSFVWDGKTVCANGKSYTINLPPGENYKIQARLYIRPDNNPGKEIGFDESDSGFRITLGTPGAKSMEEPTKIQPPIFGPTKDTKLQETEIKPTEEKKITPASPKIPQKEPLKEIPICKFVDGLIKKEFDGIRKEIVNDPEILEKFNANCGGRGGSSGGAVTSPQPTN